jgi:hypothetical protein
MTMRCIVTAIKSYSTLHVQKRWSHCGGCRNKLGCKSLAGRNTDHPPTGTNAKSAKSRFLQELAGISGKESSASAPSVASTTRSFVRHPLAWNDAVFYDEKELDKVNITI